jgi:hypothetical protein
MTVQGSRNGTVKPDATYGYPAPVWEEARQQAMRAIIEHARATGGTITYGQLTIKITAIRFDPHDYAFHAMLYQISELEEAAGRGLLSALVVHAPDATKGANMPGDGFWACAADFGRNVGDREKCWIAEVKRLLELHGPHSRTGLPGPPRGNAALDLNLAKEAPVLVDN